MISLSGVDFDALSRKALHTLWQSLLGALVIAYAASGLDVSQVTDEASAKKFALAVCGAVVAALLSAVKTTVASLVTPAAGLNGSSGDGPYLADPGPVKPRPSPYTPKHEIVAPSPTQRGITATSGEAAPAPPPLVTGTLAPAQTEATA